MIKKFLLAAVSLFLVVVMTAGIAWANPGQGKGLFKSNQHGSAGNHNGHNKFKIKMQHKFSDTSNHWARSVIEKVYGMGLFEGYEDGTFQPDAAITQAESVVLIMRLTAQVADKNKTGNKPVEDTEEGEDNPAEDEKTRTETDDEPEDNVSGEIPAWAKDPVIRAAGKGFININRFHSHVQAQRTQVAVMVAKVLNLEPVDNADLPFKDGILIPPEDLGYIIALYQEGLLKGTPEGMFNPNSAITRAELAVIMERIVDGDNEQSDVNQEDNDTD